MAVSTTFEPSGITSELRETLDDLITNIAPTDTVFMSAIGKKKISGRYYEWLEDTITTAANNAVTEGNDAVNASIAAPSRTGNYVQQSAEWFKISDILEAIDKAGMKSEVAYITTLRLKKLARDMEYALLNNTTSTATDPRSLCGVRGWISTNRASYTCGASTKTLTEALFNTTIQDAWGYGGNVDMVLAPAALKKQISGFTGQSRLTINTEANSKGIINVVDLYESDFGIVKCYASRFIAHSDQGAGTEYDYCYFLEKAKWQMGVLMPVKVEKLAKTGLGDGIQISTAYTLICRSEKANAEVRHCYNG